MSDQKLAGGMLVLGGLLTLAGIILWTGRNLYAWPPSVRPWYLGWERSLIMGGMVGALLGLALLNGLLQKVGDPAAAWLGFVLLLVATVLGLGWEAHQINRAASPDALIVAYVVLALLGQAAIGLALVQSGLLAGWIGWATIVWSLGALVVLPLLRTGDIYYPFIHMAVPLLLGITLLVKR